LSAACCSSWLPLAVVVLVALPAPPRLATPLGLSPPPQADTATPHGQDADQRGQARPPPAA
jgi:hypothetical protein